jgi:serine/threonine-protein kinase
MPVASVAQLIDLLRQYHLLNVKQWGQLATRLPRFADPRLLARELIQSGWLTPYQINQLFLDRGSDLLLGPYVVLERIGEGGMGQVFKARHHKLRRLAAIKVIRKERLANEAAVRRFYREIQAAAHLSHPNVVVAYDADQIGDRHYYSMEYVEGIDLSRLVKQQGPLAIDPACDYVRQAALGLQHAFEHGLVHRDIKPSNLLLTPVPTKGVRSVVKVLDLGLARVHSSGEESSTTLTQEGAVMGTPDYIAPEQARNSHLVDIRADLYSLGCTFYFLLAGRVPFQGASLTEKLLKHQLDEPEPIERLRPEVPEPLGDIIRKLMAKRPEDRFQSPAELAAVLAAFRPAALGRGLETMPQRGAPGVGVRPGGEVEHGVAEPGMESTFADAIRSARTDPYATAQPPRRGVGRGRSWVLTAIVLVSLLVTMALLLKVFLRSGSRSEDPPEKPGAAEQAELNALLARENEPGTDLNQLRLDVVAFRASHPGPETALPLAPLLARLPSPLDRLDPARIPAAERPAGLPKEVVAILGKKGGPKVNTVAFSPDDSTLVFAGDDPSIHLWDVAAAAPTERKGIGGLPGPISCVTFDRQGRLLASTGSDGFLRFWDAATGKLEKPLSAHQGAASQAVFHPLGPTIVTVGADRSIKLWDVAKGEVRRTYAERIKAINGVAFSPDGGTLALADEEGSVRLFDSLEGKYRGLLPPLKAGCLRVEFSPNDGRLASSYRDGTFKLWDTATNKELAARKEHAAAVAGLAFTPDGNRLATAGQDGKVLLWDTASGDKLQAWTFGGQVNAVAFASDGRHLAAAHSSGVVYVLRLPR